MLRSETRLLSCLLTSASIAYLAAGRHRTCCYASVWLQDVAGHIHRRLSFTKVCQFSELDGAITRCHWLVVTWLHCGSGHECDYRCQYAGYCGVNAMERIHPCLVDLIKHRNIFITGCPPVYLIC